MKHELEKAIAVALKHTEDAFQRARTERSNAVEDLDDARQALKCAQLTSAMQQKMEVDV